MNTKSKTCLLVLGMHRSGTSALTRMLNMSGAQLPKTLLHSLGGNQTGHWESQKIVNFNDEFLAEHKTKWDDWANFDTALLTQSQRAAFMEDLGGILRHEYNDAPLIVIKDPRICRFVSLYAKAIIHAGYKVKCVQMIRNPLEVSASLAKRNNMLPMQANLLWLRHVLDAEYASRNYDNSIVTYDGFLEDYEVCLDHIADDLSIKWPHPPAVIARDAKAFLSPKHKHHSRSTEDVLLDPLLRNWIGEAYTIIRRAEMVSLNAEDLQVLDNIREAFDSAAPMLQSLLNNLGENKDKITTIAGERQALQENLSAVQKQKADLSSWVEKVEGDVGSLTESLKQKNKERAALQTSLEGMKGEKAGLSAQLDKGSKERAALQTSLDGVKGEKADLRAQLDKGSKERAALQTSLDGVKNKSKKLSIQLEQAQGEASQLANSLKQKGKEQAKLRKTLGAALQSVEASDRKLVDEKNEKLKLAKAHAKKEEDFHEALEERHTQVWALEQKLQNEIDHNVYKQGQLDEVLNSSSWKMMRLPRKMIEAWRHKTPILVGLLAGREVREQFKNSDNIGEMAKNARSKATIKARRSLAKTRDQVLGSTWLEAVNKNGADENLPSITISAVTYNSEKWLENFLASVDGLDYPSDKITMHFVDNGSSDGTVSALETFIQTAAPRYASLKLFQLENGGYGAGNDYGIRQSKDDFVLVTNVDTEFYSDSLKTIANVAIHDEEKTACWEYRQTPHEHPKYYDPVTRLTNWTSHACVLIRKKAYLAVGGYEKKIFMYGEDVELSYRFRAHGWKLRYVPEAVIKHYVDLEDHTLRPNQLSGSASANVLLRYRYGTYLDILAGEAFLRAVKRNEKDPVRMSAWHEATRIVKTNRWHFFHKRKISAGAHFPFHEFDYDVTRPGAAVPHIPFKPEEKPELPLISVVTRTHGKAPHHLQNVVASVLGQTYKNIEHIIVEDNTDEARQYIEALHQIHGNKIRYLKSTGKGRSACGNFGAQNAKGEYLCWLDNDDLFFADHIETLVRALEGDTNAVCSYALAWDALSKMENGKPIELSYELPELHCRPYDKERLLTENFIPIQAIIFSKELFVTMGGFNEEFSQLEDWNLWARYAQGGPFVYTAKVTSLYRTPHDETERQDRHMALHAAYETVRQANLADIAKLQKKAFHAGKRKGQPITR